MNRITERTARRLNILAGGGGLAVRICISTRPKRRWYSVGNYYGNRWHQVVGFAYATSVEDFLNGGGRDKTPA